MSKLRCFPPQFLSPASIVVAIFFLTGCSSGDRNRISASGTIEATEVTISAKVGGEVVQLWAAEGIRVRRGDTLAILDVTDLEIQLRQAEANLTSAEAQYKLTVRGARREDLLQAEATLENAESDIRRIEALFKNQSVTQKQLDDARMKFTVAKQNHEKLRKGSRSEEVDVARGRRDQARAQVEAVRKKLGDAAIISPIDGIVTAKAVEVGENVMPNTPCFKVTRSEQVHIMIYVTETELARVDVGSPANIYVDGFPDRAFPGKVTFISPNAEFTPRNIQTKEERTKLVFGVKIEANNPDLALKPGMPADAVLQSTASPSN